MVRVGSPAKVRDDLRGATLEALAERNHKGQAALRRRARSEEDPRGGGGGSEERDAEGRADEHASGGCGRVEGGCGPDEGRRGPAAGRQPGGALHVLRGRVPPGCRAGTSRSS